MKKILIVNLFLIVLNLLALDTPMFVKTFGGDYDDDNYSVIQASDTGYIICGSIQTVQYGTKDISLLKTDSLGNEEWSKTYGGTNNDVSLSIQKTSDGGYILCGYTWSYGNGEADVYLIKTDPTGNEIWSQTYGGSYSDVGYSVNLTSDGGFIITGLTHSHEDYFYADVYMVKADSLGNEEWTKRYGGLNRNDSGESVQQTIDGGFIICGWTESYGNGSLNSPDVYLIKTDSSGNETWYKTYGDLNSDLGMCVQQMTDNGYIIQANSDVFGDGYSDIYLIRTDVNGDEVWSNNFGGSNYEEAWSLQQTSDNGFIVCGYTYSYGNGNADMFLVKADLMGNEEWSRTFGKSGYDEGRSVYQSSNGGYIISGITDSYGSNNQHYIIKTDSFGRIVTAPKNISTCESSGTLTISWDTETCADSYLIYSSDNPYNDFIQIDSITTNFWYKAIESEFKGFYYVIAKSDITN